MHLRWIVESELVTIPLIDLINLSSNINSFIKILPLIKHKTEWFFLYPPVSVFIVDWPLHAEQSGQDVDEDSPDPRSHGVGLRGAEMNIQNNNRYTYTKSII